MGNAVHPVDPEAGPEAPIRAKKWLPWLVVAIVVANTVTFIVTMYVNNCPEFVDNCVAGFLGRFSFQPLKENPLFGPSPDTLTKVGALVRDKVVHEHQGWRLVTCMWVHAGVLHLLTNMLSLLVIGIRLEQEFGCVKVGLLYLISGIGGNLLSALFIEPATVSVGASGAVFGLLGGMLSELIMNWSIYAHRVAALLTLVTIIIVNLGVGLLPHVDNFAHIGGFLSGFLLGFVFLIRPQFGWTNQRYPPPGRMPTASRTKFTLCQYILWVLSLVLLIVGFAFGIPMALHGFDANEHCSWCRYLSCVPTKKWSCNSHSGSCRSVQTGDQITLTCLTNETRTYTSSDATTSVLQRLCDQLCS